MSRKPISVWDVFILGIAATLCVVCLHPPVQAQSAGGDPCAANLKQIASALSGYMQDYDGALPPMASAATVTEAAAPYVPQRDLFHCPVTHNAYKTNASLSAKALAKLAHPHQVILMHDALPHPDGRSTFLYADGHITHLVMNRKSVKGAAR